MPGPVELRVGGQTYRVVASAEERELRHLASLVDEKLRQVTPPGRAISPQSLLLAAIALAHDLEHERSRRERVESRSRELMTRVLTRIDEAIAESPAPDGGDEARPDA
jgi:cell division protein ZapA